MPYDVGQITRDLQSRFRLFDEGTTAPVNDHADVVGIELADKDGSAKNLATPENLEVLLAALQEFTDAMVAKRDDLRASMLATDAAWVLLTPAGLGGWLIGAHDEALAMWDQRVMQWRGRLGAYDDAVNKAPAGDRQDVLWSVTAPLLLGFFGGEASNLPQQPLDAVTPFMLANQLQVLDEWRDERWALFVADLEEGIANAVSVGGGLLAALVPIVAIVAIASFLRRR